MFPIDVPVDPMITAGMAATPEGAFDGGPSWSEFRGRHPGSRFLEQDPLFSLSGVVLDAVRRVVPGFFTAAEVRFERDLAAASSSGLGFSRGQWIDACGDDGSSLWAVRPRVTVREDRPAPRSSPVEEWSESGLEHGEVVRENLETEDGPHPPAVPDPLAVRRAAYTGWLLTNPEYLGELSRLRDRWGDAVTAARGLPRLQEMGRVAIWEGSEYSEEFLLELQSFYERWSLARLACWDWPVVLRWGPPGIQGLGLATSDQAGEMLFVPRYLLTGKELTVQEMLGRYYPTTPAHLRGWADGEGPKDSRLGDVRYATVAFLHRNYHLVLLRRYPDRCAGNLQRLDRALAAVIGRGEDTVKKLRRALSQVSGGNNAADHGAASVPRPGPPP